MADDDVTAAADKVAADDAAAKAAADKTAAEEKATADKAAADDAAAKAAAAPDGSTVLTDGADGPQGAPAEYADFDLPENMEINGALLDAAQPVFKETGLSQIQAQALVDMFAGHIKADSEAQVETYKAQMKTWQDEARADSVIGGDKFDEKVGRAKAALDKFGSPGLIQMLNDTGLGNHPDMIRFAYKVGLTLAEDDPGGGKPPIEEQTPAEIMYGEK